MKVRTSDLAVCGLMVVLALGSSAAWAQSSSTSFDLRQSTPSAAGDAASSSSFKLAFSLGQPLPVGASSSPTFILQGGVWGFAGAGPIPIVLAVDCSNPTCNAVDLSWSGNEASYSIYAATDCASVLHSLLTNSTGNDELGLSLPEGALVCVNVQPMPPDPAPRFAVSQGVVP